MLSALLASRCPLVRSSGVCCATVRLLLCDQRAVAGSVCCRFFHLQRHRVAMIICSDILLQWSFVHDHPLSLPSLKRVLLAHSTVSCLPSATCGTLKTSCLPSATEGIPRSVVPTKCGLILSSFSLSESDDAVPLSQSHGGACQILDRATARSQRPRRTIDGA